MINSAAARAGDTVVCELQLALPCSHRPVTETAAERDCLARSPHSGTQIDFIRSVMGRNTGRAAAAAEQLSLFIGQQHIVSLAARRERSSARDIGGLPETTKRQGVSELAPFDPKRASLVIRASRANASQRRGIIDRPDREKVEAMGSPAISPDRSPDRSPERLAARHRSSDSGTSSASEAASVPSSSSSTTSLSRKKPPTGSSYDRRETERTRIRRKLMLAQEAADGMHKRCAELAGQLAELDCDEPLSVEGDSAPARAPRVSQHTVSRGSRKSLRHGLAKGSWRCHTGNGPIGVSVDQQGATDSEQGALEERPRVVQLKVDADVDADRVIAHDREVSAAPLASGKPRLKPTRGMGCCAGLAMASLRSCHCGLAIELHCDEPLSVEGDSAPARASALASGKPRLKPTRGMGCCTGPRNAARCLAIGR